MDISNPELMLYTLHRGGGAARQIELEDLFEQCWQLFPSRFGWKRKSYPSDKAADQGLRDLMKAVELRPLLRLSADRSSARLTAEGVSWVRDRLDSFDRLVGAGAPSQSRPSQRHLVELEHSDIAAALIGGDAKTATRAQVADLLRLTPDADARAFRDRLESWRSDAELAQRRTAIDVLARLETAYSKWFEGGGRRSAR
jgi:hypothetical protein